MKVINHLIQFLYSAFLLSATPNLFGSIKRRKAKETLAGDIRKTGALTESELNKDIADLEVQNPFETAAAKSAMTASARKAKQAQKRFANMLGGQTNPEAIIGAQQATQEAVAGTAGDIAVGAEAQKQAQLSALEREKRASRGAYMSQAAQAQQDSINERGAGWRDFFSIFGKSLGGGAQGAISAIGSK